MKIRYVKALIVVLLIPAFFLMASPVFATDPPDSNPSVGDIKANKNLIETGDVLIYGKYDIPYASVPVDNAQKTYIITLLNTDGVTQIGDAVIYPYSAFDNGYNLGVFGFYFTASDNLTTNQAYIIRISQSPSYFEQPQIYDYTMPLSAWTSATDQENNQLELTLNIISLAETLENAYSVTLLEDSAGGTVLSSPYGETYFRGAIYGIQAMAPELFLVQSLTWDTSDKAWTTAQFDQYGTRFGGTFIGAATDNTSSTFGVDSGTMMGILFLLPITLGAVIVSQIKWRKMEPGYLVGAFLLIMVSIMGWIQPAIFATIYQLLAMYIGYLWFYSRAGEGFSGKTMSFLAFVWVASVAICLVIEGSWWGGAERTVINDLSAFTTLKIGGLIPIPAPNLYFFRGVFRMLLWDYSFYTGDFQVLRWIWLIVFTGAAVYSIGRDFTSVFANFLRIK